MTSDELVTKQSFVALQEKFSKLIGIVRDQDKEIAFLISKVAELESKVVDCV